MPLTCSSSFCTQLASHFTSTAFSVRRNGDLWFVNTSWHKHLIQTWRRTHHFNKITSLSLCAAAGEELGPKAATPGFASSKKPEQPQHSGNHKRPAAAPVGEELDEAITTANTSDSPSRHLKRRRGMDPPAHVSAPIISGDPAAKPHRHRHGPEESTRSQPHGPESSKTSTVSPDDSLSLAGDAGRQLSRKQQASGSNELNRSPTNPQETHHHQQQKQQQLSGSDSGSSHSSSSDSGSHPASAHPLPSWRQQERQEPEEEAEAEAARPRSQSRPYSRSGSQTHNSAQAGNPDGVAGVRTHPRPHRPHHGSPKPHPHQSTSGRGPRERSLAYSGAGALPSAPDCRLGHRANHRADRRADNRADLRPDQRADHRAAHRANYHSADHRADHRAHQPRPSAPRRGLDRADWQQPSAGGPDTGGYLPYGVQTHSDRQRPQHPQVLLLVPVSSFSPCSSQVSKPYVAERWNTVAWWWVDSGKRVYKTWQNSRDTLGHQSL